MKPVKKYRPYLANNKMRKGGVKWERQKNKWHILSELSDQNHQM